MAPKALRNCLSFGAVRFQTLRVPGDTQKTWFFLLSGTAWQLGSCTGKFPAPGASYGFRTLEHLTRVLQKSSRLHPLAIHPRTHTLVLERQGLCRYELPVVGVPLRRLETRAKLWNRRTRNKVKHRDLTFSPRTQLNKQTPHVILLSDVRSTLFHFRRDMVLPSLSRLMTLS